MATIFRKISKLFNKNTEEIAEEYTDIPIKYVSELFDQKYEIIVGKKMDIHFIETINWVNENSKRPVDVKFLHSKKVGNDWLLQHELNSDLYVFFAFQDVDDALYFKIKYML